MYWVTKIGFKWIEHFKLTNKSSMFSNCSSLTNLDLSSFNTSKVIDMWNMFLFCKNLTTTINIYTSSVIYINMFGGAATVSGAQITVDYVESASDLVDQMIATKSSDSNVVKGKLLS